MHIYPTPVTFFGHGGWAFVLGWASVRVLLWGGGGPLTPRPYEEGRDADRHAGRV